MSEKVRRARILREVVDERRLQDLQWGSASERSLPSVADSAWVRHGVVPRTWLYGMPHESMAKEACDVSASAGEGTWAHVAVEELAEVIDAPSEEHRRRELVQLAAVAIAWIENIDSKGGR